MSSELIKTNELSSYINELRKVYKDMSELFSSIKRDTNNLKDYWSTKTSDVVYSDFNSFYPNLESNLEKLNTFITYLEGVKSSYTLYDEKVNDIVESQF